MQTIKLFTKKIFGQLLGKSYKTVNNPDIIIGEGTKIIGKLDIRVPGGKIIIGKYCNIESLIAIETGIGKVKIGDNVFIGGGVLGCVDNITIEDNVLISYQCIIQDSDNHSLKYSLRKEDTVNWLKFGHKNWDVVKSEPVYIEKGAWLGARVLILKGVRIGEGAIIGAGSVVTKNIEPWTVVGGNPAKLIRRIDPENR